MHAHSSVMFVLENETTTRPCCLFVFGKEGWMDGWRDGLEYEKRKGLCFGCLFLRGCCVFLLLIHSFIARRLVVTFWGLGFGWRLVGWFVHK